MERSRKHHKLVHFIFLLLAVFLKSELCIYHFFLIYCVYICSISTICCMYTAFEWLCISKCILPSSSKFLVRTSYFFSQYLLKAVVWLLGYIVRCSLIASNLHFLLLSNSNALFRLIWHITVFSSEQFIMLVLLR